MGLLVVALVLGACSSGSLVDLGVGIPPLAGEVDLAALPAGRTVQATLTDVAAAASVSLIEPDSGNTVKTALTDAAGAFALSFGPTFAPSSGSVYFVEAVKGLGNNVVGKRAARLRTLARWTGTSWATLTSGGAKLGTASTALAAIYALKLGLATDKRVSAADLMGSLGAGGYAAVANASALEYGQVRAFVTNLLSGDRDPLANLGYSSQGGIFYQKIQSALAPDDAGDPAVHHDYVLTKDGVGSTFVWIPVFTAYQLIIPGNCGAGNTTKPTGYWVKDRPGAGAQDQDWALEVFGGFYAGKYEASRADAAPGNPATGAGATAGASASLKVARYCVPWASVTWDEAASASMAYDAHAHLMRDEEWTALAVWATINGVTVYGNNAGLGDRDRGTVTFVADPTSYDGPNGRGLTGSGADADWSGATNLTTHTGTTGGVFDLNGNVTEWTGTLGAAITSGNYVLNDVTMPVSVEEGLISALSTDPRLRRYGVPGATGTSTALLGRSYFGKNASIAAKAVRGSSWPSAYAGLWFLFCAGRSDSIVDRGFRPALRF